MKSGKRQLSKSGGRSASSGQLLPKSGKSEPTEQARGDASASIPSRKRWKELTMGKIRRRTLPKVKHKFQRKLRKMSKEI